MKKIVNSLVLLVVFASSAFAQLANWSPGNNAAYTNFPVNQVRLMAFAELVK